MIDRIGDDMVGRYYSRGLSLNIMSIQRGIQVDVDAKSGTATILVKQKTGTGCIFERSTATGA